MCREGLFLPSGRCISSDLTLAEGRCVLSALSPGSALAPPSHPSFRLGGTADGGERETTGRALKYIAAGCGHISLVSTGKLRLRAHNHHNTADKNSCPLISRPRIQILATKQVLISVGSVSLSLIPLGGGCFIYFMNFRLFSHAQSQAELS